MSSTKSTNANIPDVPKLNIVRWTGCDLDTGLAGLSHETAFVSAVGEPERRSALSGAGAAVTANMLFLKKSGIVFALVSAPHQALSRVMLGVVRKLVSALKIDNEAAITPQDMLTSLFYNIENEVAENTMDVEAFQDCHAVIGLIRDERLYLLKIGSTTVQVFSNRLKLKNLTSLDGLGGYAFDTVKSKALKKIRRAREGDAAPPKVAQTIESRFFPCRYEVEDFDENSRIVVLMSPLWMPAQVDALCRVANETQRREAACTAVWQMLRNYISEPSGKVLVIDIMPKDADLDRNKNNQQNNQSDTASRSASKAATKGASGLAAKATLGKVVTVVAVALITGVAVYVGAKLYKRSVEQNGSGSSSGQVEVGSSESTERRALKSSKDSLPFVPPVHIDSTHAPMSSSADGILRVEPSMTIFDKLQNPSLRFAISSLDSMRSGGNFVLTVRSTAATISQGDWSIVLDPAGTKSVRWLVFKKPLPSGLYDVQLGYIKPKGDTSVASTKIIVLSSDLQSLKKLIFPTLFIGKPMVFRVKLLDDIRRALGANAVPIKLLRELAVVPYFDNKPVFGTLPFDDSFLGPCLSALTKKARFDIVWKSALTSETVTLYTSKEAEPQQKVPQVIAANVVTDLISNSAANARKNAPPRPITLQLKVRNIAIDYSDSPIDVADPLTCRGIFPSLDNIEPMGLPRIQYDDTESRLRVVSEDGTVDTDWVFSSATVKILDPDPDTRYIQGEGSYTIKLEIRGLPSKPQTERRFLKGTIAITAGSKLTNTLANKIVSGANGVVVTINQEY